MSYKEQVKAEADRLKGKVDYYADHVESKGKLVKASAEGWMDKLAAAPFARRFAIFFALAIVSIIVWNCAT